MNCSVQQLFLNLLVPASFSVCATCQISVRRSSVILTHNFLPPPNPHFLQAYGMVASSITISFYYRMGYRYSVTRLSIIHGLSGVAYN